MAQSNVKVKVMWHCILEILPFSKSIHAAIFNGSWQLTADCLTRGKYLNLFRPDFELGQKLTCDIPVWLTGGVDHQSHMGLIFLDMLLCYNICRVCVPSVLCSNWLDIRKNSL